MQCISSTCCYGYSHSPYGNCKYDPIMLRGFTVADWHLYSVCKWYCFHRHDLVLCKNSLIARGFYYSSFSQFSSVQFIRSVVSDSLWLHGLQHIRPPWTSPTPRVYSNTCPLSQWCHPTISSSVIPFSSCFQSCPVSGSFPMSQYFPSDGQSIGASASVLPMNIQDWFSLGWTGWISLQSKGLSRVFSNTTVQKHQFFGTQLSL